jgi:type II secretory ATPase GspE/PulE/Tfp pilus assembly ATPase PilB-like protein
VLTDDAPITKLVDLIFTQAVRDKASDIHIEPEGNRLRIRFRIDGILYEIPAPPKHLELAIISRIKVLSELDIASTRIAQDGQFVATVDNKEINARVSTIPTIYGESVVVRIISSARTLYTLKDLGFDKEKLEGFENIIVKPHGIVLVTGPTGSGKTTTLYAAINRINSPTRKIITVEDPVEYRLESIRQIPVNIKAGLTFANALQHVLRQDPDVIMVGEIRNIETAQIAVNAALTGHMVFSTLHTNDAAGAITRLKNMGVEPFLISGSIIGVVAQRLIRLICTACKEPYEPSKEILKKSGIKKKNAVFYKGAGCQECKDTGYSGRTALFEIMAVNDEMRDMIVSGASSTALKKKAEESGMKSLRMDGVEKVMEGQTTIEEVFRVTEDRVEIEEAASQKEPELEEEKIFTAPEVSTKPSGAALSTSSQTVNIEEYREKIASWLVGKNK